MVNYPQSLPTDAMQTLMKMIMTKSFDKQEFGLALWNVQGYAQDQILGEAAPLKVFGAEETISDEQALDALQTLQENESLAPGTAGMNPALKMVLTWALKKALELL